MLLLLVVVVVVVVLVVVERTGVVGVLCVLELVRKGLPPQQRQLPEQQ